MATKKGRTTIFSPLSFVAVLGTRRSKIRDRQKTSSGIREEHPGSAALRVTLLTSYFSSGATAASCAGKLSAIRSSRDLVGFSPHNTTRFTPVSPLYKTGTQVINTTERYRRAVLWIRIRIRIRKDAHHFDNLMHQIKIRIRIRIYKLDPEPEPDLHQFADVKPKCMEYEPILALSKGFL